MKWMAFGHWHIAPLPCKIDTYGGDTIRIEQMIAHLKMLEVVSSVVEKKIFAIIGKTFSRLFQTLILSHNALLPLEILYALKRFSAVLTREG